MSRVIGLLLVDAQFAQWLSFGLEQQGYLVLRSEQPERDLHEPDDQVQAWRPDIWLASASLWRQARNSPLRHGKDARAEWHWLADTAGPASAPGLWPTEPRALLLRLHEYMAWAGSLLVLVHAGIHFNAILGWLAVGAMLINVASGLTGKFLMQRARRRLDEAREQMRQQGLTDEQLAERSYWDSLTFDAVKQWRSVHFPITLAFAVLALAHIVAVFLFWGWK